MCYPKFLILPWKPENSQTATITFSFSDNWAYDNAVWLLWHDPNYAIFKEAFWVHLLSLCSARYFGKSVEVLQIAEVDNFKKWHVCEVQTTISPVKQKYMTLELWDLIPTKIIWH
jgi:hypothetical protein